MRLVNLESWLYLKIVIETHYITFQDINLQPYFKIACVKSVLWPVSNSNVVDVSLSGYWTACNNFKRHCTLPYCDVENSNIRRNWLSIAFQYWNWPSQCQSSPLPVSMTLFYCTCTLIPLFNPVHTDWTQPKVICHLYKWMIGSILLEKHCCVSIGYHDYTLQ